LIDALDPDIPDSYYADYDPNAPWQAFQASEEGEGSYGDPGSVMPSEGQWGEGEEMEEGDEDAEGEEDDFDQYVSNPFFADKTGS
jgi:hypothetical protein